MAARIACWMLLYCPAPGFDTCKGCRVATTSPLGRNIKTSPTTSPSKKTRPTVPITILSRFCSLTSASRRAALRPLRSVSLRAPVAVSPAIFAHSASSSASLVGAKEGAEATAAPAGADAGIAEPELDDLPATLAGVGLGAGPLSPRPRGGAAGAPAAGPDLTMVEPPVLSTGAAPAAA